MNPHQSYEEKRDWIERILLNLREGHGSVMETKELQDLLMKDREARQIYLRSNQLDGMLESTSRELLDPLPTLLEPAKPQRRIHWMSAAMGAGIAAAIALLLVLWPSSESPSPVEEIVDVSEPLPLASLEADYEAVFDGSAAKGLKSFGEGELSLARGIAQLAFRNGVKIVLEGKCGFEILNEMTVVLNHGKMWAYCPPEARGFKVLTPGGKEIIDLGTEFGIEVAPSGATDVHVYDGLVDVVDSSASKRRVTAGEALSWSGNTAPNMAAKADFGKFVTAGTLTKTRLKAYHSYMSKRQDLLLHYRFDKIKENRIQNRAPNASAHSHGRIIGANRVAGRLYEKDALQFEKPGDGIKFHLERPADVQTFTMAVWVKINRFSSALSTLVNSDGWQTGAIHFQVTRGGSLKAGMNGGTAFESPSKSVVAGQWHLLAVTWDTNKRQARLYCDGKRLSASRINNQTKFISPTKYQFGNSQIGSWISDRNLKETRSLQGRVDEVMIFNHALSDEEMENLYHAGKL